MWKPIVLNRWILGGLLTFAGAANTFAAPLVLHNTGEGLVQGQLDPNWTVVLPGIGGAFGQAISATDPNGAWIAPVAGNTWISVAPSAPIDLGTYKYTTTFFIDPAYDPGTAQISGFWWSDDPAPANGIYLNGVNVSAFAGAFWFDPNFANAAFSINSGFVPGVNELTFYVTNTGGPGGMLIQGLTGTVPEPAVFVLIAIGLGAARLRRLRLHG